MVLPYQQRRKIIEEIVSEDKLSKLIPMTIVETENDVRDVLENSINSGCEGLMLKVLDAPYRAGMRGSNWLKLKREYRNELGDSLDLVVVGAFLVEAGEQENMVRYCSQLIISRMTRFQLFVRLEQDLQMTVWINYIKSYPIKSYSKKILKSVVKWKLMFGLNLSW